MGQQLDDILHDFPLAVSLIEAEEGFREKPYRCPAGALTIGFGYNLDAHGISEKESADWVWTREKAQEMLLEELADIVAVLDQRFPAWREKLDSVREAVVLSSFYQLGERGALAFKNTIKCVQASDWDGVAKGILNSRWAKQDPDRAQRNANAMRTGKLPEVVRGVRITPTSTTENVAPAPVEPTASPLPAPRLPNIPSKGAEVGQPVGAVDLQTTRALTSQLAKLIGKSPITYGATGLFTMLVGNVRIKLDLWVFDQHYLFQDGNILAALVAVGVVAWGLIGKHVKDLRQTSTVILALIFSASLTLPACSPFAALSTGGGQSSASLGPDRVLATESSSTLPERVLSGVDWLWSSYTALKARVDPTIEPMRKLYVAAQEALVAAKAGDWLKALTLYGTARALVTEISGMVGK